MKYIKLLTSRNAFVYNSYYILTSVCSPYEFYFDIWKLRRKVYILVYMTHIYIIYKVCIHIIYLFFYN